MSLGGPKGERTPRTGGGDGGRGSGFALRFAEGKAYVVLANAPLWGVGHVDDVSLEVAGITFPFDVSGGAEQFQGRLLAFHRLQATLEEEALASALGARLPRGGAISVHEISLRAGFAEVAGALGGEGAPVPFTFKVGLEPEGDAAARAVAFDVRTYGPSAVAAPLIPDLIVRAAELPTQGGTAVRLDLLRAALRSLLPPRGFKLPDLSEARLRGASFTPGRLTLRFGVASAPVEWPAPRELLSAVEGARVFAEAERRLARGDLAGAREAYRSAGDPVPGHPFAAERLLAILLSEEAWRDEALDLSQAILARDPESATARWGEAMVRAARGDDAGASKRLLELAAIGREKGELLGVLAAAHAAGAAAEGADPMHAARAYEMALAVRPSDLASLRALAGLYPVLGDTAGAIRINRRMAAHAEDPREKAAAQARLGHLYAGPGNDLARARLHYDAALRLVPDDFAALAGLAQACEKSGEHLRAVRCLDRLRALALAQGNTAAAAAAARGAARLWEERLGHSDNALLGYREAASLDPDDPEGLFRLAKAADRGGHWEEALDAYTAYCDRAGPAPTGDLRKKARDAHVALAKIRRERLADADAAARELTLALELEPDNLPALWELARLHRDAGRKTELVGLLLSASELSRDVGERAAALSEAGLALVELGRADEAEDRLRAAVAQAPQNAEVWRALAELARARSDARALCDALSRLADLAVPGPDRVRALWALAAAARDEAQDLKIAAEALDRIRHEQPGDPAALAALADLHRRRGDQAALAEALDGLAEIAAARGDAGAAAAALRERAGALERAGDLVEASKSIARARTLAPRDAAVLAAAAHLAFAAGDHAEAASAYRALLEAGVDLDAEGGRDRALFLLKRLAQSAAAAGDADAAAEATAWALGLDPADAALAGALDDTLARRPRDRATLRLARANALAMSGERTRAAALAAEAAELFEKAGDVAHAAEAWRDAEAADHDGPHAPHALSRLASLLSEIGDAAGAADALMRGARSMAPREAARALTRASALEPVPAKSRAALESATQRDPGFAPARVRLGRALLDEGDSLRGGRELAAAAAISPGDPDAPEAGERATLWHDAALAAHAADQLDDARRWLDRYLALSPHDARALERAGELAEQQGDTAAVGAFLERRLEIAAGGESTAILRRLAALWSQSGAAERALSAWKRVLELEPGDQAALRGCKDLLEGRSRAGGLPASELQQNDQALIQVLAQLAERAPPAEAATLWTERATVQERQGDRAAAAASCGRAVSLAPTNAELLDRWAQLLDLAGDREGHAEALSRRAELAQSRGEPRSGAIHAALARAWSELMRDDRALAAWERALEQGAEGRDLREALQAVAALAAEREPAVAVGALEELAPLCPPAERAALHLERARLCRERLGDLKAGRRALEDALAAAPQHPAALAALEEVCEALGDWEGVAAAVTVQAEGARAAGQFDAATERFVRLAGVAQERLHDAKRALDSWRSARALAPRAPEPLEAMARLLSDAGEHAQAAELTAERARLESHGPAAARRLLEAAGLALAHTGDPSAGSGRPEAALALTWAREAGERDPDSLPALQLLAELVYEREQAAGAVGAEPPSSSGERATASEQPQRPDSALALSVYRKLFARLHGVGDKAGAVLAAHRLGALALGLGAAEEAAAALREAQALVPSADTARRLFEAERAAGHLSVAAEELARFARPLPASAERSELLKSAAEAAVESKSFDLAAELYAAAQDGAADPEAMERSHIEALHAAGKHAELAERLAARAARTRSAADWMRAAALYKEQLADLPRASAAFTAAAESGAGAEALRLLAATEIDRGAPSSAARALERLAEALPAGPERAAVHHQRGALLLEKLHDESGAEASFRAVLELDPAAFASRAALESLLEHQERRADLARSVRERAGLEPDGESAAALLDRAGDLLRSAGEQVEAEAAYRAALERDPACVPAAAALESLLEEGGRWHELAEVIAANAAHETADEAAAALQRAGELLRERAGDLEGAERAFAQAVALDPDSTARAALESIYTETGRWKELAESITSRAVASEGEEAASLMMQVGDLFRGRANDPAAAENAYRSALEQNPRDAEARGALEALFREAGRWPELAESIAANAEHAEDPAGAAASLVDAAQVLSEEAGDPTGAEALLRSACERDPAARPASAALIQLLSRPGHEAALADELERAAPHRSALEAVEMHVRAAAIRHEAGDDDRSERDLLLALETDGANLPARTALEALFESQERWSELAASHSARASRAGGAEAARWRISAARLLADKVGDSIGAEAEFRAALAADPRASVEDELAALLWKQGNAREAAELELAAFSSNPTDDARFQALVSRLDVAGLRAEKARACETRARARAGEGSAALFAAAAEAWMEASDQSPDESEAGVARCMGASFALDPTHDRAFAWVLARAEREEDIEGADLALARRADSVPEQAASLHAIRGQRWAALGRAAEAAQAFTQALAVEPGDVTSLAGMAALAESDAAAVPFDDRLLTVAGSGIAVDPPVLAAALYRRGFAAHGSGDMERADDTLSSAISMAPDDPRAEAARELLAEVASARGDPGPLVDLMLGRASAAAAAEREAFLLRAADACARANDPGSIAVPVLRALTELRPDDPALSERLAAALARVGRPADHAAALERAARAAISVERRAALWLELAQVRADRLSDAEGAAQARLAAFEAAPADLGVLRAVVGDLRAAGREDALAGALEALEQWADLARLRDGRGEREQAAEAWQRVAQGDAAVEAKREAFERLASRDEERGELAPAARWREALADVAASGTEEIALLQAAASLWTRAGDVDAAARLLERAVDRDPALASARHELVQTLENAGRHAEAAQVAAEAAERAGPEDRAEAWLRCASLRSQAGDAAGALQAAQRAVLARPGDRQALATVLELSRAAGDDEARLGALTQLIRVEKDLARSLALARERAALLATVGRTAEAAEIWLQVFDAEPGDLEAYTFLEGYMAQVRDSLQLADLAERRERALSSHPDAPREVGVSGTGAQRRSGPQLSTADRVGERARLRVTRARALADASEADQAAQAWRAVLELDPRQPDAVQALLAVGSEEEDPEATTAALASAAQAETDAQAAARLWLRVGKLRVGRLGDSAGAVEALQRARGQALVAGQATLAREVALELASALDADGRPAESLIAYGEVFAHLDVEMHTRAAAAGIAAGDLDAARRHLEAALGANPEYLPALERRAEVALASGDPRGVGEALSRLAAAHPPGRGAAGLLLQAADALKAAGDSAAEEAAVRAALEKDPRFLPAYSRLRTILADRGAHEDLAGLLRQHARKADSEHARASALRELGDLLAGPMNDKARAIEAYERCVAVEPDHPGAAEALAALLWDVGRKEAAEPVLRRLVARPAVDPLTSLRLGQLLQGRSESAEAHELFTRAAKGQPTLAEAWRGRVEAARALVRTDLEEQGLVGLARALELAQDMKNGAQAWFELAELRLGQGRGDEAAFGLEMALRSDHHLVAAARMLVELRRQRGEWQLMLQAMARVLANLHEPAERAAVLLEVAEVELERMANPETAQQALESAVQEQPGNVVALTRLVEMHASRGRSAPLMSTAEQLAQAAGDDAIPLDALAPLGRAYRDRGEEGDPQRAFGWLSRAFRAVTEDKSLGHELAALAADLGHWDSYVDLATKLVDAEAAGLPKAELAVRYRAIAEVAQSKLADPQRSASLLEKAVAANPGDIAARRALCAVYAARQETASLAIAGYAQLARQRVDAPAVRSLAELHLGAGDAGQAALLSGLADWLDGKELAAFLPPPHLGGANVEALLSTLAEGSAAGAIGTLVRGLAPIVEPLFPSGLAGRGVTDADRAETQAPFIAEALRALAPVFTRREFNTFVARGMGVDIVVENANPAALVVGAATAQQLSPPALMFLAARALVLLDLGYALVGRFSARDVGILTGLVVRFFEPGVPAPLPPDRLEAYLKAMESLCPPELRAALEPLAPRATMELMTFDTKTFAVALRKTANRAALLALGDAATALQTLALLDPRYVSGLVGPARAQAVAQSDELRDLYLFCLQDSWMDLRRQARLQ